VALRDDTLFHRAAAPLRVNATHVDTVVRLPPSASVLAKTELEPHAAVRFNETTWGVQFHPELDAEIMRAFLEERRELIANEGLDAARLLAEVDDAPAGASMLDRFVELLSSSE
jgi:GMP synthase (glutamine-hydrolysing)